MRFAPTERELAEMRPLVDLVEERMALDQGITLDELRAQRAAIVNEWARRCASATMLRGAE